MHSRARGRIFFKNFSRKHANVANIKKQWMEMVDWQRLEGDFLQAWKDND